MTGTFGGNAAGNRTPTPRSKDNPGSAAEGKEEERKEAQRASSRRSGNGPYFFLALFAVLRLAALRFAGFFAAVVFFFAALRRAGFLADFFAALFLAGTRPHLPWQTSLHIL